VSGPNRVGAALLDPVSGPASPPGLHTEEYVMPDRTTHWLRLTLGLGAAILFAAGLPARADDDKKDAEKELRHLEGTWKVVSREVDGKKVADEEIKKLTLNIAAGGRAALLSEGSAVAMADVTVFPAKKPKEIDLLLGQGENKGKIARGIYELKDDTLRICYAPPGKDRPTEFSSKPGSGNTLSLFKR
jgi:uncharacterized protein (TIGR03067 family)